MLTVVGDFQHSERRLFTITFLQPVAVVGSMLNDKETAVVQKTTGYVLIALALYLYIGDVWAPLVVLGFGLIATVDVEISDN